MKFKGYKFLYHLEQVITTRKMKKKRREEYEGKDEMDAYDLFRGSSCSFTNGKWKKKKRDRTSICGNSGSGVASSCNYDDDGTDGGNFNNSCRNQIQRKGIGINSFVFLLQFCKYPQEIGFLVG